MPSEVLEHRRLAKGGDGGKLVASQAELIASSTIARPEAYNMSLSNTVHASTKVRFGGVAQGKAKCCT